MNHKQQTPPIIIITGSIGSGKTTFLAAMIPLLQEKWSVDGFTCLTEDESRTVGQNAPVYKLKLIDSSTLLQWAMRKNSQRGYEFNLATQQLVSNRLSKSTKEIIVFDDLGPYELKGEGFAQVFSELSQSNTSTLIVVIKKRVLDEFIIKFNLLNPPIFDLDHLSHNTAKHSLLEKLHLLDSEQITLYATIAGFSEITVGSTLHGLHVPLKGHLLNIMQTFLMIQFAKELKGRGLLLITAVAAGLKSFSPTGSKLKPMLYILVQGSLFTLPIFLLGVNIISIMIGSLLLGVATIYLSLLLNFIIYGSAYLNGIENILKLSLGFMNIDHLSFWTLIFFVAIAKSILMISIAIPAYYLDFSKIVNTIKYKIFNSTSTKTLQPIKVATWSESVSGGFKDLILKKFVIPFIFTSMVIFFFTHLNLEQFSFIIIRALVISWFGFVLARRINFQFLADYLTRHGLSHWAVSLEGAIKTLQNIKNR